MESIDEQIKESIDETIKDWKQGLSWQARAGIEVLPALAGAAVGGAARITNTPGLIALPPVMDLIGGVPHPLGLIKYLIGASLPYADIIYPLALQYINS